MRGKLKIDFESRMKTELSSKIEEGNRWPVSLEFVDLLKRQRKSSHQIVDERCQSH